MKFLEGGSDITAHPPLFYQRPSGAAAFVSTGSDASLLDLSGPTLTDPNTGAMTRGSYLPALSTNSTLQNFALVFGLLLVTMFLESGRKVSL